MYKKLLYCLALTMSMHHVQAATRIAQARVEQEEDDRGMLTKTLDIVCTAVPYFVSMGALWFCYSVHQTHNKHAEDLNKHADRLKKVEDRKTVDQVEAKLNADIETARKDRFDDLAKINALREQNNKVVEDLAQTKAQLAALQKERDVKDSHHAAASAPTIKVTPATPDGGTPATGSRRGSGAASDSDSGFVDVGVRNPNAAASANDPVDKETEKPA